MDRQSALRTEVRQLIEKKREIQRKASEARQIYQEKQNELGPEIDRLQSRAETLAAEFRRLYEEASIAYEAGQGSLAKALSEAGHEAQDRCEAINAAANRYRRELKKLRQIYLDYYQRTEDIDLEINELQKQISQERRNLVATFPSPQATERFLSRMPQAVLERIVILNYSRERVVGRSGNELAGRARYNPGLEGYEIEIYRHGKSENIRKTIAHEVGHVIFDEFLSGEERKEWEEMYSSSNEFVSRYAIRSPEEDFCACYAMFHLLPGWLEERHEKKYTFIKKVNRKLEELQ